jgi:hypothetical protein
MAKIFKCKCGDNRIFVTKTETLVVEVELDEQFGDFDFTGKEEVQDCHYDAVCCGNGCTLEIEGTPVTDYEQMKQWIEKYGEEEPEDTNIFALFDFDDVNADAEKVRKSREVTEFLVKILDKMVADIVKAGVVMEYLDILNPVANQIKALQYAGVGIGDTATDECIAGYVEEQLRLEMKSDTVEKIGSEFYDLIHR